MAEQAHPAVGLFGPGSVTWRIMGEPVILVAGFRALYLQALHPRTMRATWQNTAFARPGEAWGRFGRTTEFVRVRTYGTIAEAERAGRRVRKIHASLTGTDADGSVIRLDEPELLLWVHCGEISSYADVARRCGMGLAAAELDEFVAEQRRSAAVVGLDPAAVPGSMAELDAYYQRIRPELYACDEAKRALLRSYNPDIPWPFAGLKLVVPPLNTLAFASLPRWARRMYGAPGSPVTDMSTTVALRAVHQAATRIPRQVRGLPAAAA
ncbi:MAG TPA: oxygenase MpaB family protein [Streptosporangiaceae bacterium]|nr:oxygenase MpaB family protein [Streptosporangiaceae bacterium]